MMSKLILCSTVTLIVLGTASAQYNLPSFIKVCHRTDPQLAQCMKGSVEAIRPYLVQGIRELDIPPIEPLLIGDLLVSDGGGLKIRATNVQAYGPSNFVLKKMKVVEYGNQYQFQLEFPTMQTEGIYDIDGRIVLVPVKGNGQFHGNFSKLKTVISKNI